MLREHHCGPRLERERSVSESRTSSRLQRQNAKETEWVLDPIFVVPQRNTRHSSRADSTEVFVAERVHGIVRLDELFAVVV
jgi:hypothetical protein